MRLYVREVVKLAEWIGPVMRLVLGLTTLVFGFPALASGTMYYGPRVGMEVEVVSRSGASTAHAVIHIRHTQANARAFCRYSAGSITSECIKNELAMHINENVTANCINGEFVDFNGRRYQFKGLSEHKDAMAKYRIADVSTGKDADGSNASGYATNAGIFKALCPRQAPDDPRF